MTPGMIKNIMVANGIRVDRYMPYPELGILDVLTDHDIMTRDVLKIMTGALGFIHIETYKNCLLFSYYVDYMEEPEC